MAKLLFKNKSVFNHLRMLHTSVVTFKTPTYNLEKEKKEFNDVLPEVINSLLTDSKLSELPEVGIWVKKLLDYTLSGGSQSRGFCVPMAYQMMERPESVTEENLHSARVLGWCGEMLQAYFLLLDDIIDGSKTRRGKTCWYRLPNIGLHAINDSLLIQQSVMEILKINFEKTQFFIEAMELFNNTILYTSMGEYFDTSSTYNKAKNNIDMFTMDRYNIMAMYKSAYNSFRLPIFLARLLLKDAQQKDPEKWYEICMDLGKYLQFKNDFNDVYGEVMNTGKVGTDIEEGKCTWLSISALQRCNENQRSTFTEYYGSKEPEHVKRIKRLYDELFMPQVYEQHDRTVYKEIMRRINALPTEGETKLFLRLLNACYKSTY